MAKKTTTKTAPEAPAPKVPTVPRKCPKCGSETATGPRYCAPDVDFPVSRLLYICSVCRFISADPPCDATDDERRILAVANERQLTRVRDRRETETQPLDNRSREIRDIIASETRRRR